MRFDLTCSYSSASMDKLRRDHLNLRLSLGPWHGRILVEPTFQCQGAIFFWMVETSNWGLRQGWTGRGWKSAWRGKKARKSTDPKNWQKCVNCYWDICSVLWCFDKGKHFISNVYLHQGQGGGAFALQSIDLKLEGLAGQIRGQMSVCRAWNALPNNVEHKVEAIMEPFRSPAGDRTLVP